MSNGQNPTQALMSLVEPARAKQARQVSSGLARLRVALGGCSAAVGASQVLAALRAEASHRDVSGRVIVAESGCNGECSASVQVTLKRPDGTQRSWKRVRPEHAGLIFDAALGQVSAEKRLDEFGQDTQYFSEQTDFETDPFFFGQRRVLLEHVGSIDPTDLNDALLHGAYAALVQALQTGPDAIVDAVERSGLAGRGGAYFPVARKWQGCRQQQRSSRHLVINAEEGEPGVVKDRHLLEGHPHQVVEGALIAAYAIEAAHLVFYVNGHATLARHRLAQALEQLRERGVLGGTVFGSGFPCQVEIREGAGGYPLGEETAMLESIEGQRPMPRIRPPYPAERGLYGCPTVIQNVETVANLPAIIARGPEWFASLGTERWKGTKLISVSGAVRRPGLVEVEIGTTLRQVIDGPAGGVRDGRRIQAILTGGPSGNLIPPTLLDRRLEPRLSDILLGSGNLTVLDDTVSLLDIVRRLTRFNADSSCGKCTPCREGVRRMQEILDRAASGTAHTGDIDDLLLLCDVATSASICGLGQMAGNPIRSALEHFSFPELSLVRRGGTG